MVSFEVSAQIGAMIVHMAAAKGVDPVRLREATGFDPALAHDPDARIPLEQEESLWSLAARLSGDEDFGLHAAEALRPGAFDVLDYSVRTAPTLREALERLVRYNRLVHDVAVFTLIDEPDRCRIEHGFQRTVRAPCRHAAEFTLASILVVASQLIGERVEGLSVAFSHGPPASLAEHLRIFGVEPTFHHPMNALELHHETLTRPIPGSDPGLSKVIQRHADALLAARPIPVETTGERVRALVAEVMRAGEVSIAEIASRLRMSVRSLQRRLAAEGLSFDAVVDELRRELALRYLGEEALSIAEVAYLLGYSEPSAFHRAFKRWTGATPSEARRRTA